MKIFKETEVNARAALDSINSHFGFPNEFVKTYSRIIEYGNDYGFIINLDGKYDASGLIDTSKVVDYIAPEPVEEEQQDA